MNPFTALADAIYAEDELVPPTNPSFSEAATYRNRLKKRTGMRGDLLLDFIKHFPVPQQDPSPFTVPLIATLGKDWIDWIIAIIWDAKYQERDLLTSLRNQLYLNLCTISGVKPYKHDQVKAKAAKESPLSDEETAKQYFRDTPLLPYVLARVPLKLSHEDRFSHMHLLAASGSGKTTLIEDLIHYDLRQDEPPSLVVMEPHSDFIRKLAHTDLGRDPIVIDARYPIAINPFALNQERLASYDEMTREQVTASTIQTLSMLLADIFDVPLTGKQATFFRFIIRFLLSFPDTMGRNATILDMFKLMEDMEPYQEAISELPSIQREFFEKDFKTKVYADTREQVRYRLQSLVENPTFARLFTSPDTKIDFFTELNRGAVILIDTAKSHLADGSSIFGKLMFSLISHAIMERAVLAEKDRKPTFLIIDEAWDYFTNDISDALAEFRKYKTGMVLSHHYLDQATPALRSALEANTGIKFCTEIPPSDARTMAQNMRTTADFILSQPKYHFAAYIRNSTKEAVSIPVRKSEFKQLSEHAYLELIERNRERVSGPVEFTPPPKRKPVSDKPDYEEDVAREPIGFAFPQPKSDSGWDDWK